MTGTAPRPHDARPSCGATLGPALLAVATLLAVAGVRPAAAHGDGSYPRTFCLDWRNDINAAYASRYDVLVHSARVLNDQLDSLRMFNPSIRRLAHNSWYVGYSVGPSGYAAMWGPFSADDPKFGFERKYWDLLENNGWWLYAVDSSGVRYHASMAFETWCGNFTSKCPPNAYGQRLCDVYADFLIDNLVSQRHIEGIFFDYCNDGFGWMNWYMWGNCPTGMNCNEPDLPRTPDTKFKTAFDCNLDGLPDPADSVNVWWRAGMNIIMNRLRERLGESFMLVGNGQHHFTQMNGAMIEKFPFILGGLDPYPNPNNYKWRANMLSTQFGYLNAYEQIFAGPRMNMVHAVTAAENTFEPARTPDRERFKRLTLGSALLADGYYGTHGPTNTYNWWEPEYDLRLGWPAGPATTYTTQGGLELWKREFQHGAVWVNANGYPVNAEAGGNPAILPYDASITQTTPLDSTAPGPSGIRMESPWPNPSAAGTTIRFALATGTPATLQVYDVRGRMVRELWSGVGTGESQAAVWDGLTDFGTMSGAGVYFATLFSNGRKLEQRLVRLR